MGISGDDDECLRYLFDCPVQRLHQIRKWGLHI